MGILIRYKDMHNYAAAETPIHILRLPLIAPPAAALPLGGLSAFLLQILADGFSDMENNIVIYKNSTAGYINKKFIFDTHKTYKQEDIIYTEKEKEASLMSCLS